MVGSRALQCAVAIAGLVPIGAGLAGILLGPEMAQDGMLWSAATISLDSHFRYLSGLLLGIGVGFWSLIPGISRNGARSSAETAKVSHQTALPNGRPNQPSAATPRCWRPACR